MDEKEKEQQIEKIAVMLKNNGLAASMYEAREKAKNIVTASDTNAKNENKEQESGKERFAEPDYDVQEEDASLDELMKELGIEDAKEQEEQKSEDEAKESINESKPEKDKQ